MKPIPGSPAGYYFTAPPRPVASPVCLQPHSDNSSTIDFITGRVAQRGQVEVVSGRNLQQRKQNSRFWPGAESVPGRRPVRLVSEG
ncbi:MAG TPA: hypothetical protein VEL76_17480 [Gemmataceae bacterium]|nr:hypothetical protein [Gemmataceae bacterium]